MGNIFCIGQSVYDITVPIEGEIIENQKYRIMDTFECAGGPAFNSAYLCSKWGEKVYLISRIGEDEYGRKLKQIADSVHIHMDYLISDEDIKTPYSYIFSNQVNGARTLFNFPGKLNKIDYEYPDEEVSVILSDGHELEITIGAIAAYPDAISIVDAGSCREDTLEVAKQVDYLVCSEDFARQYTGKCLDINDMKLCEEIFKKVENINKRCTIITMGERGLLYREGEKICHLPAYPAQAVDTNGAGDIFHGAFAYGINRNMSLLDILKLSSMTAAISVEMVGSQTSIPTLETVQLQLQKRR